MIQKVFNCNPSRDQMFMMQDFARFWQDFLRLLQKIVIRDFDYSGNN